MATQEKQTFSMRGAIGLLVLMGVAYILVQSRSLLTLYTLTTVLLSALLVVVAFDLGLKKEASIPLQEPDPAPPPSNVTQAVVSRPARKKRRR